MLSFDQNKLNFESYMARRVSYILPTKNSAVKLGQALERLRGFKCPEDELIVMDGGSTDHTEEVVNNYRDVVDIFISEPDRNNVHAVNKGFFLSRGKYIKTIADDDVYHPDAMRQAIETLELHPEIDLLICGGTKEKNGVISYVYVPPGAHYGKSPEDLFRYGCWSGVGHFFRRSAIAIAGLHPAMQLYPNGKYIEVHPDAEYTLRFIAKGLTVQFCRLNLYHHPYSHYGVLYSSEYYWRDAARRYCSRSFYYRYLASRISNNFFLAGYVKWLKKKLRRYIPIAGVQRMLGKKSACTYEYIWDGGLS